MASPPHGATRGVLKKELTAQLRTRRQMRHAKGGKAKNGQGHILDMVSIRERPAEAEDRAVPGHWEGDLLTGASDTHIATLVERHSRFTMLVKLPRKDTTTVVAALAKHIRKLPEQLRRSLTWDQGKEMSGHKRFTVATNVQVYFCDPRSPWQRGSNENTNGLLRQYFPRARHCRAGCLPRAKRRVDAVNQFIVAKWFWQVANDSETENLGSNIFVRLSGNQNSGNAAAKRLEAAM